MFGLRWSHALLALSFIAFLLFIGSYIRISITCNDGCWTGFGLEIYEIQNPPIIISRFSMSWRKRRLSNKNGSYGLNIDRKAMRGWWTCYKSWNFLKRRRRRRRRERPTSALLWYHIHGTLQHRCLNHYWCLHNNNKKYICNITFDYLLKKNFFRPLWIFMIKYPQNTIVMKILF